MHFGTARTMDDGEDFQGVEESLAVLEARAREQGQTSATSNEIDDHQVCLGSYSLVIAPSHSLHNSMVV